MGYLGWIVSGCIYHHIKSYDEYSVEKDILIPPSANRVETDFSRDNMDDNKQYVFDETNSSLSNSSYSSCEDTLGNQPNVTTQDPETALQKMPIISEKGDFADTLKKLAALHEQGIITDEEFAMKKKEILDRI